MTSLENPPRASWGYPFETNCPPRFPALRVNQYGVQDRFPGHVAVCSLGRRCAIPLSLKGCRSLRSGPAWDLV